MCFDDYNYDLYNKYVLVDPNFNPDEDSPMGEQGFVPKKVETNAKG